MPIIEVSVGELIDRFTILEVKSKYLDRDTQIYLVSRELQGLSRQVHPYLDDPDILKLKSQLREENDKMWVAMQRIYDWTGAVNVEFQETVVSIIELNKRRAILKREIDVYLQSELMEAKSFFKES